MTTSDYLNAAADLIEREGWVQGTFYVTGLGCCPKGAIREVCGTGSGWHFDPTDPKWKQDEAVTLALCLWLHDQYGDGNYVTWNDAPERTKAEVVAGLRAAAVMAAEQEATV